MAQIQGTFPEPPHHSPAREASSPNQIENLQADNTLSAKTQSGQAVQPNDLSDPHPTDALNDATDDHEDALVAAVTNLQKRAQALKNFADRLETRQKNTRLPLNQIRNTVAELKQSTDKLADISDAKKNAPQESSAVELESVDVSEDTHADAKSADSFGSEGKGIVDSLFTFYFQLAKKPLVFAKHYEQFAQEMLKIVRNKSDIAPERGDLRFRDAVWQDNFAYRSVLKTYLAWHQGCKAMIDEMDFAEADRQRSQFLLEQFAAAISPSNSILNPVSVKRAFQTGGESWLEGAKNLLHDVEHNGGMPSQINRSAFKVGEDLGMTPGVVVYRSEVLELIQYNPHHTNVYKRPILIVPPQINKFYVFDLSPKNSIVNYLLDQGLQVFIVSWKNPSKANAEWGMDDYCINVENAMDVALDITGSSDLSLISACAGGVTSMALLAYLGKQGRDIVKNHSLLVTALQIGKHPTLNLFLTKEGVAKTVAKTQRKGVMEGRDLANVFAWLRPTELVWSYYVNNYLLGKDPPALDVLYWDNDPTRLPAALHKDFMDIFINDRFAEDVPMTVRGEEIDLRDIKAETYMVAGEGDYLMPWKNVYANLQMLDCPCEFILSDSGHIQSVLRPPGIGRTTYFTAGDLSITDASEWKESATENKGSWWEHWRDWLQARSGEEVTAAARLGNENFPPLCAAPGEYVYE